MSRTLQRSVAVGLTVCLLLLSGLMYAETVPHAAHHTHHQTATHATALCSWMCAAGQGLEGVPFAFQASLGLLAFASVPVSQEPTSTVLPASFSRGPPSFSV